MMKQQISGWPLFSDTPTYWAHQPDQHCPIIPIPVNWHRHWNSMKSMAFLSELLSWWYGFSIFFPLCILVQLCPITRWLSWLSRFWRVPDFPTPWSCCHIALPSSGPRQWARPISQGPDGSVEGFTCASTNKDVASCGGCKTAFPTWFSWSMLI